MIIRRRGVGVEHGLVVPATGFERRGCAVCDRAQIGRGRARAARVAQEQLRLDDASVLLAELAERRQAGDRVSPGSARLTIDVASRAVVRPFGSPHG